jgi:hypothetical protein
MDSVSWLRPALAFGSVVPFVFLLGCHRATREDCERIVDRVVELELAKEGIADPKVVEQKKAELRKAREADLMRSCVGRQISKSALRCIERARTPEQITDECLR